MENLYKYFYIADLSLMKRNMVPQRGFLGSGTFQYLKAMQFLNLSAIHR